MEKNGKIPNKLLQQCLVRAVAGARQAGEAILEVYQGDIDVEYKEDKSPLTLADKRAHSIIMDHLRMGNLEHIPILSEEGKDTPYEQRKSWDYFWLVDPLDGTKEFIKRRGEFTVNVALIKRDRPVLGVVHVPVRGFLYFAAEGMGSYRLEELERIEQLCTNLRQGREMSATLRELLSPAKRLPVHHFAERADEKIRLVGSRSHGTEALSDFVRTLEEQRGEVEFVAAGSALKFCLVAEGSADIYPRFGPTMEWDTAAGQCVVEQSGGMVLQMKQRIPLRYNRQELRNPYFVCLGRNSRDFQFPH